MSVPKQLILFGSPGVGKSHYIDSTLLPELNITPASDNCIKTVFHPEYTYGDFMGKLLPLSRETRVEYTFHEGHFLRALARAFSQVLANATDPEPVALVIDEMNRGNSSAIFGSVFQLLDRDPDGWSSYHVNVSQMEFDKLTELIGIESLESRSGAKRRVYKFNGEEFASIDELLAPLRAQARRIRIPPNLYILATINTSDTSIYYMDAAFKRRWDWEYIDIDSSRYTSKDVAFADRDSWIAFIKKLNEFIKANAGSVRFLEDKQVGIWFLRDEPVLYDKIQNKLMFFVWDSVFQRERRPLATLLGLKPEQLQVFGDFARRATQFVKAISEYQPAA